MKLLKTTSLAITALALTACSGTTSVSFDLELNLNSPDYEEDILDAAELVVERQIAAFETYEELEETTESIERDGTTIKVTANEELLIEDLTRRLTRPFSFEFMEIVPLEEAEIVVAETEGYAPIGLTGDHVEWLTAEGEIKTPGSVKIQFTAEGTELKNRLFSENIGEHIGLFVRGMPVYKLLVEDDDIEGNTLILNIPDAELGYIFADDVNVGLQVAFTPSK